MSAVGLTGLTGLKIFILGTGKMAHNAGALLLRRGALVTFVGRSPGLERLRPKIERELARANDEGARLRPDAARYLDDSAAPLGCDLVLECVAESLPLKQGLLHRFAHCSDLLASVSSSFLPSELHPRCVGLHLFYPVELTGFVELVLPSALDDTLRNKATALAEALGLFVLRQSEQNAFAANRLLLPVQARCFEALRAGYSPAEVDRASVGPLLSMGQLSMMDAIGLDTLCASVRRYSLRAGADLRPQLDRLVNGVAELVSLGRLGKKNGQGLRCGNPLSWTRAELALPAEWSPGLAGLFLQTCRRFLDERELTEAELTRVLDGLFGVAWKREGTLCR